MNSRHIFFTRNLHEWLRLNLCRTLPGKFQKDWAHTFTVIIHALWERRNKAIFDGTAFSIDDLFHLILRRVDEMKRNFSLQKSIITPAGSTAVPLYWVAPPDGWWKLNVDASFLSVDKAATGGIIRDHSGTLIQAFCKRIEAPSPLAAELIAILSGINLALAHQSTHMIMESDCKHAIDLIKSHTPDLMLEPEAQLLVDAIKSKINTDWSVVFNHIHRSCNSCADGLARSALNLDASFIVFTSVPRCISLAFLADMSLLM